MKVPYIREQQKKICASIPLSVYKKIKEEGVGFTYIFNLGWQSHNDNPKIIENIGDVRKELESNRTDIKILYKRIQRLQEQVIELQKDRTVS